MHRLKPSNSAGLGLLNLHYVVCADNPTVAALLDSETNVCWSHLPHNQDECGKPRRCRPAGNA